MILHKQIVSVNHTLEKLINTLKLHGKLEWINNSSYPVEVPFCSYLAVWREPIAITSMCWI